MFIKLNNLFVSIHNAFKGKKVEGYKQDSQGIIYF